MMSPVSKVRERWELDMPVEVLILKAELHAVQLMTAKEAALTCRVTAARSLLLHLIHFT